MIKIERSECPARLSDVPSDPPRYNHPDVVDALSTMQYGKCCYCEKFIDVSGHEQGVDHYRPQAEALYPRLRNTWSNLLHSCAWCNGKKWSHFPLDEDGEPLLVDPSDPATDPENIFDVCVDDEDDVNFGRMIPRQNRFRKRAEKTEEVLELNYPTRRTQRTCDFIKLFQAYMAIRDARDDITKQQKVIAFQNMLGANSQYAAFARAFARAKRLDKRFGIMIPVGAQLVAPSDR